MDAQRIQVATLVAWAHKSGVSYEQILAADAKITQMVLASERARERDEQGSRSPERAINKHNRVTTTEQDYVTVVSWTVASGFTGHLSSLAIEADRDPSADVNDYAYARWRITTGPNAGDVASDVQTYDSWDGDFLDTILASGTTVKIEVKSSDGTEITVDANIVGKESV